MTPAELFEQIHREIDPPHEEQPTEQRTKRYDRNYYLRRKREKSDTKSARAARRTITEKFMDTHPQAILYKEWREREARRCGIKSNTVHHRVMDGKYPDVKREVLNARIVFVLNP